MAKLNCPVAEIGTLYFPSSVIMVPTVEVPVTSVWPDFIVALVTAIAASAPLLTKARADTAESNAIIEFVNESTFMIPPVQINEPMNVETGTCIAFLRCE